MAIVSKSEFARRKGISPAIVGRQLFLHGSEMLQTHRQVNNDAAYGRFGDFALR